MKEINLTTKITVYHIEECNETEKNLIEAAKKATRHAYVPYSNFSVGAAVLLENGEIISGNNQENAAYPSGLCAERVAMFYANAQYPEASIEAIAVAACHDGAFTVNPCSPCGGCRQVLLETENRHSSPMRVILYGENKIYELKSAKALLPVGFGKESLDD